MAKDTIVREVKMVKSCSNRYHKGCGLSFYRFPVDSDRRSKWIAAVKRENWQPNEHSWVCSAHFVSGKKSDDPLSPDFVPSVFSYVHSPEKRRVKRQLERYEQRMHSKKRRLECQSKREVAAEALLEIGGSSHSVLQADTQGGTKEVATQTDAVCMTDASTSTSNDLYCNGKHSCSNND